MDIMHLLKGIHCKGWELGDILPVSPPVSLFTTLYVGAQM